MLKKGPHFNRQWRKRVGGDPPRVAEVLEILEASVRIQKFRDDLRVAGTGFGYRMLSLYWHPERNLVIKVDEGRGRLVTVLTPETRKEAPGWRPKELPSVSSM